MHAMLHLQLGLHLISIPMTSTSKGGNGPISGAGEERIRELLKSHEEELAYMDSKIFHEETQLTDCKQAIFNLNSVIPDGRKVLQFHKENLSTLMGIHLRLAELPSLLSWRLEPEATSRVLCNKLEGYITMPASSSGTKIQEHMDLVRQEIRLLQDHIHRVELELEGWRISERLFVKTLARLRACRGEIERDINEYKLPFRALWKTPADVWTIIFKLVKEEELRDYIKQNDMKSLRSIVFVLSHVCRSWRSIVSSEPSLWNLVYAPPVSAWRQDEYDLLTSSAQKCNGTLTLLTNAYQAFPRGYYPANRYEKDVNTWASVVTPNENVVFPGRKYTLHINTRDDHISYLQRMSSVPFKQPSAIIYSATLPLPYGFFFNYVTCGTIKSFTIINDNPAVLNAITLASYMPQLTILRLRVKQFPSNFALTGWLPATLEELYLHHEISGTFPPLGGGIQLPKLHTLGITSASTPLIQNISMPELRALVLYGTSNANQAVEVSAGANADQIYRRLVILRLAGWGKVSTGVVTAGAVSMLDKVVSKAPGLHSIELLDSSLDGEALVRTVTGATRETDVGKLKYLTEITLNGVSGITRDQCDQIKDMVTKLNIYV